MLHALSKAIALALVGVVVIGSSPPADSGRRPQALLEQDALTGLWHTTLVVASGAGRASHVQLDGRVALLPLRDGEGIVWTNLGRPTHIGVYDLDLQQIGAGAFRKGELPIAGGSVATSSKVKVVLNPAPDHGAVVMDGQLDGDSIFGSWYVTAYAGGYRGTFKMRR